MMRRRRGPGLVGTMARTAVIAGTATATVNAVSGNAQKKQAAAMQQQQTQQAAVQSQQEIAALQAQQAALQTQVAAQAAPAPAAPIAAAPAAPAGGIDMEKLKQLGELHTAGILTDEEFAAAKAKVLG